MTAGGPIAHLVVTPDMVPPAPEPFDAKAAELKAQAVHLDELHNRVVAANTLREQSAQSFGFDAGHEVNRQWAVDLAKASEWYAGAAAMFTAMATVFRDVAAQQQSIIQQAEQKAAAAKNPLQVQGIVEEHHAFARGTTTLGVQHAVAQHSTFLRDHGSDYAALVGHGGGLPQDPVLPQPSPGHGGIVKPVNNERPDDGAGDPPRPNENQPIGAGGQNSPPSPRQSKMGTQNGADASDTPPPTGLPAGPLPGMPSPVTPATGVIRSTGMPGSLGGGGGMGGGMPAGGLSGLGSGNPLSGLTSGLGQTPGTAGGGLSGLPSGAGGVSSAAPAVGQPSAAFAQGLAAGSGAGTSVPPLPPTTGTGTPASGLGPGAPAAGLSSAAAAAPSAGIGSAGAHVSPVGAGSAGGVAPPAMMLPSPGMGAPAAPVSAGGAQLGSPGAMTAPAGGAGPTIGSAGNAPAGAAGGGAALVPAGVVGAGGATNGARGRTDSPELAAAKALARQLRRDSDAAGYAVIEWAVGVFRSESDATTETVFMSNEGFGYIPQGVFVPRSARLLALDRLADSDFREKWFSWRDPGRVLVEYAALRSQYGARLVAAAVTNRSEPLRAAGVECAVCPRELSAQVLAAPVLDDMHAHRLSVQCPDVYARIVRLAAASESAVLNQLVVPLAMQMVDAVQRRAAGVDCPPELRQMWDALGTGDEIPESAWEDFERATLLYFTTTSASAWRPGFSDDMTDGDTAGRAFYRDQWLIARTMDLVRGWARRPPPLADMVYAAASAYPGDFAAKLEPMLRVLEDDGAA
uniref:Uncharacterized protein n=1 Tax=Mycobacterium riyadhense TaxID=486698 RepID=A0A653EXN9_9MYCO|nr:hypothetical protein BIN_B_04459 [Mycobacterium riyadhense]